MKAGDRVLGIYRQGIARAYGCAAARASTFSELADQLRTAQTRPYPTVIEVMEEDFLQA